jgi:hypothetical protein
MTELVVAVYASASAANMAIDDLEVARVPTARIRHEARQRVAAPGEKVVAVTVEDRHASAVTDILNLQVPIKLAETPFN